MDDLKNILRSWHVAQTRYGRKYGQIGKVVSGSRVYETDNGKWWVTYDDGTTDAVIYDGPRQPVHVIVQPNDDGDMEVIGLQVKKTLASVNYDTEALAQLKSGGRHRHYIGSGNEDPVESRRFEPGLLHAYSGLTVYIEPFLYDYNGTETRWPGGTIDLTSNRPSTSSYWAWVKVGINPATNVAVATTGTEKPLRALLTSTELDAINFDTSGYIPCGGVILQQGQTTSPIESDFADARDFIYYLDPARPPAIGGTTPAAVTGTDITANRYALTAATTLIISGGVVTATKGYHLIESQTGTSDDLDTINGMPARSYLIIQAAAGHTIAVKNGTGNMFLNGGADFSMSGDKTLLLYNDGTNISDVGAGGGSSSPWQTDSNVVNLVTDGDTVTIGSATAGAKLFVHGDTNEVQLDVRGHSSQATDLQRWTDSTPTMLMTIANTGDIVPGTDILRTLGTASKRFLYGYAKNVYSDALGTWVKNTSGATANANHVGYITYTAGSGAEYKTTTTANANVAWCVVLVGGANNADIYVATSGVVTVELNASCSVGDFLTTSTTAGRAATNGTNMRPEVFAVALTANGGGAGGTCTARLYTKSRVVPYTNADYLWGITATSTFAFVSTISGAPSATSVVYGAVSAGNENNIVPLTATDLLKMRLWNTTRNTYRVITAVNTATNTITTVSSTDAWANGDAIQMESTTVNSGLSYKFAELDFSQTTVFPTMIRSLNVNLSISDSGGANAFGITHPLETYGGAKIFAPNSQVANVVFRYFGASLPIINRSFTVSCIATGTGTASYTIQIFGYEEAMP